MLRPTHCTRTQRLTGWTKLFTAFIFTGVCQHSTPNHFMPNTSSSANSNSNKNLDLEAGSKTIKRCSRNQLYVPPHGVGAGSISNFSSCLIHHISSLLTLTMFIPRRAHHGPVQPPTPLLPTGFGIFTCWGRTAPAPLPH